MIRRLATSVLVIGLLFAPCPGQAQGGDVLVTFDETQLVNNDPLLTFYDGGMTFRGIGGGPDVGVEFTLNARLFTVALTGTYTPPGWMALFNDNAPQGAGITATMNVESGFFGGMAFDYAAIDRAGELQVYSGFNGTGTLLADLNLPVTSPTTGPGVFVADSVTFSGVAESIVFIGGNKQLGFDDLSLSLVPEPPAWTLLAIGGMLCAVAHRNRPRAVRPDRREWT
jgi:hypothetical protein